VLGELLQEVDDEERDVLLALAQRRHVQRHHVETVEEVLAKAAGGDLLLERLVRRGDHAHVDLDHLGAADARDDVLLQHAQHLGLGGEAHVADLVEEQGAAVGLLELPRAVPDGTGEGAAHVPEQLALDQLRRDGRAVHLDERPVAARRLAVNRARDELLAGAVLAGDEHARRRGGHLGDAVLQRPQRVRLPHHLEARVDALAQPRVLLGELHVLERVAQQHQDAVGVERLLEDVVGAELGRLDGRLDRRVPADHDDGRSRVVLAEQLQRLEPVHAGHLDVEEDEVRLELLVQHDPLRRVVAVRTS
jgi:hypothetical protein